MDIIFLLQKNKVIKITRHKLGERKKFNDKIFTFHSMANGRNSLENKKAYAKKKGYLVRSMREGTRYSFWTRKK